MRIEELEIITDINNSTNNKNKPLLKNAKIKKIFDLDNIELEEFVDNKSGKCIAKYSSVCQNTVWFKVNKPYKELKELMLIRSIPVLGFAAKSKRYKQWVRN